MVTCVVAREERAREMFANELSRLDEARVSGERALYAKRKSGRGDTMSEDRVTFIGYAIF